jgi:hypothetical protein
LIPRVVKAEALARWNARELIFPERLRMTWDQGSSLAQACMVAEAADALGIDLNNPPPDPDDDLFFAPCGAIVDG